MVILANNHRTSLPSEGITPEKRIEGREREREREGEGEKKLVVNVRAVVGFEARGWFVLKGIMIVCTSVCRSVWGGKCVIACYCHFNRYDLVH